MHLYFPWSIDNVHFVASRSSCDSSVSSVFLYIVVSFCALAAKGCLYHVVETTCWPSESYGGGVPSVLRHQ